MRRRHKIVMSAVAAVVPLAGWFAFVPAAAAGVPPYDNSQDTVVCTTVTKGIIKASPPLISRGAATPTTLSISGTLGGCSSPSHPSLVFPEGKSKFKGTITSTTNNCTSLAGATTGTGTITFSWSATDTGRAARGELAQKDQHAVASDRGRRRGNLHVSRHNQRPRTASSSLAPPMGSPWPRRCPAASRGATRVPRPPQRSSRRSLSGQQLPPLQR